MYEYIKGLVSQLTPTYVVIEANGIGYLCNISLNCFSKLSEKMETTMFIHQVIREDAHLFFGFAERKERDIFRQLITVNGIGANTARMILSSLKPEEVEMAIINSNANIFKSVKGIGLKTAQRIIVDLKDKVGKQEGAELLFENQSDVRGESLSALVMLGFSKNMAEKVVNKILSENNKIGVEELIKEALKRL
jgi:holliday junction DNA helicase RuvA